MPIPFDDILVESLSSGEMAADEGLGRWEWSGASIGIRCEVEVAMCSSSSSSSEGRSVDMKSASTESWYVLSSQSGGCTEGWCRTRSGRKEFSSTKDAPKQVFAMMASSAPRRYRSDVTPRKHIIAIAPMNANISRNFLRNAPWSAAPDIEMMSNACTSTLAENVYIAKLAVLISMFPR